VDGRLTDRDRAILATVSTLRLVTSAQLSRLHFAELGLVSRDRVRRRVVARLVAWEALVSFPRRIGGDGRGSSGLVLGLGPVGLRLMHPDGEAGARLEALGGVLLGHTLMTSELYTRLVELSRDGAFKVERFETEPACWRPKQPRGWLKPDAFVLVKSARYEDHWFVEADQGTQHLPVIGRKVRVYLDYWRQRMDPGAVMPRVLFVVPDEKRRAEVARVVAAVPNEAERRLFEVVARERAAGRLLEILLE
jgi:hypothetical protein